MKRDVFTLGHESALHCGNSEHSEWLWIRGKQKHFAVDTGDGELLSWFLEGWPLCSVSRKKHQRQQLFPKEGLLESEFK